MSHLVVLRYGAALSVGNDTPRIIFALVLAFLFVQPLTAKEAVHLGVATCAGSNCHGASTEASDGAILQNEFLTWHRKDKHATAYRVLFEPRAEIIAARLGLKAAHQARQCLVCHTDFVAEAQRGRRFQISDGVGCEGCHGGAEQWLGPHVSGQASHAENIALGMYPTHDPRKRADLCLGCHMGDDEHPIDHRIMGAGHPRLGFELDTFSAIQPAHFVIDADYERRKQAASHALTWAIGQTRGAGKLLNALKRGKHRGDGVFPELIFFNCHACHRAIGGDDYQPPRMSTTRAGEVRFQDHHLIMTGALMEVVHAEAANEYQQGLAALQAAAHDSKLSVTRAAELLLQQVDSLEARLAEGIDAEQSAALLQRIQSMGAAGTFADYSRAEQAVMAMDALTSDKPLQYKNSALSVMVRKLLLALRHEQRFNSDEFTQLFSDGDDVAGP